MAHRLNPTPTISHCSQAKETHPQTATSTRHSFPNQAQIKHTSAQQIQFVKTYLEASSTSHTQNNQQKYKVDIVPLWKHAPDQNNSVRKPLKATQTPSPYKSPHTKKGKHTDANQ